MVDESENAVEPDEQEAPGETEKDALPEGGTRSPGAVVNMFWSLGRAVRGVTIGSAWLGSAVGNAIVSAFGGVSGGIGELRSAGTEPVGDDADDAPPDKAEAAVEEEGSEELETEEAEKKKKKK